MKWRNPRTGYGKSAERKLDGRVRRRHDERNAIEEQLEQLADESPGRCGRCGDTGEVVVMIHWPNGSGETMVLCYPCRAHLMWDGPDPLHPSVPADQSDLR